ncbi:MAG TPA: glycoside hydrolase family 32 protein, partial [Ohtaekwangia sp.]|uniref:glycoside hydrolase family 32 protein n=1 Tax=Ohtaekwangia sp. TaxID=2066019 RepID=UPI002F95C36E
AADSVKPAYTEQYRPAYHFSPAQNWTNDPNGLVYFKGEYHLFYQYNPYANVWGHMSWGHAVSNDLLHWEHLPVALREYTDKVSGDSIMIFSGSAVVDSANTSGFFKNGEGGIVAMYTSHVHKNNQQLLQHQSIAYSADKGRTFTRYENNPVLDKKLKDFRDPKVFWYAPGQKWIVTVVIPDKFKAQFYESKDLKEWKLLSEFGPIGDTAKIWECPDLVEVPLLDNPTKKKWVLLISNSHPQGPAYVGMQYFVGNFDGKKFIAENPKQYPLYLEYGKDFYAAVTFNNIPQRDGRTILLGWANNWAYGQAIPTHPWRSAMTLPREIYLRNTPAGYRIVQRPVKELLTLRGDSIPSELLGKVFPETSFEIEYELIESTSSHVGLKIVTGKNEESVIGYDRKKSEVYFDRTRSGNVAFHTAFASVERVPVKFQQGKLKLHVFVDNSIVEVYINDGEQVITDQIFPTSTEYSLQQFSEGGNATTHIQVWKMKSIWLE